VNWNVSGGKSTFSPTGLLTVYTFQVEELNLFLLSLFPLYPHCVIASRLNVSSIFCTDVSCLCAKVFNQLWNHRC